MSQAGANQASRKATSAAAPTVCLLYGFCEGRHIGRELIRQLEAAGFATTKQVSRADVIIAHSGGCFVVPPSTQAKIVLLVGLPCWPGKSTVKSLRQKIWRDAHAHQLAPAQWLRKTFWNSVYFWNIRGNYRMWQGQHMQAHRGIVHAVLVRNREDVMCTPDYTAFHFDHLPGLVALPGEHDDCWHNPQPYVDIVRQYYYAA